MFYLFLAKQFIRTQWRSQNEYRFSFIMGILAQGTNFVFRYLALYLLVSRFGSLNGWNSRELLLIYSFSQFTYAIGSTFTHDLCRQLPNLARTGDLNSYLIRPVHSLFPCNIHEFQCWIYYALYNICHCNDFQLYFSRCYTKSLGHTLASYHIGIGRHYLRMRLFDFLASKCCSHWQCFS